MPQAASTPAGPEAQPWAPPAHPIACTGAAINGRLVRTLERNNCLGHDNAVHEVGSTLQPYGAEVGRGPYCILQVTLWTNGAMLLACVPPGTVWQLLLAATPAANPDGGTRRLDRVRLLDQAPPSFGIDRI